MQAQVYEGYFKAGRFYVDGKTIHIPEQRRVFITILDVVDSTDDEESNTTGNDDKKIRAEYLKNLNEALAASMDEELVYIPRSKKMREPVMLTDED